MARSRAIPIVSPFCPAQNPFAGVREDEPLNLLEASEQSRLKNYYGRGFESRLKRCGAVVGLPASLPPLLRPVSLLSPHILELASRRYTTAR